MSNNFSNIKTSKTVRINNSNNNILKALKTNKKKFNKKENNLKKSKKKSLKKSNVSIINDSKYLNNSLIDFLIKKNNGFKPNLSYKNNNIMRLNRKHNNMPSSNNITLDMDEIVRKRNNFNKRTNSSIIRNSKIKDFKRLNTHYENKSKLNKNDSNTNSINKSIKNIKKLQTTNYSEKKRKPRIKLMKDVEPIKSTSKNNLEASEKKPFKKVNHIRNISTQNPEVLYNNKFNKQFTKDYAINKIKKEIKLSPSVKTKTNYKNFTTKKSKKIDFNDNASLNSSCFLKRKIKIIPMSEYKERSLQKYNKKLKNELKDYKEYKEKYEEAIKENKKIQQKNKDITKRYVKLIQKLKEMKEKLQKNNNNNESEEKDDKKDKKEKSKSRNNSAEKNRVTNNFTIQSQLNIFMTEPNLGEKESSNGKEKEELKKEKNDIKNKENNNDKDIQEDENKRKKEKEKEKEKESIKILNDEEKKEVEDKKKEIRNILNIFKKKTVNLDNNKKNNDDHKKEKDNSQKKDNKYLKMVLKDLLKSKAFNYRENLQKYFLRYYYNVFYLKRLEDKNKKHNIEENEQNNINDEIINESNNSNKHRRKNKFIKIEYKNRDLYTVEELKKVKRDKELRDLFYNKIKERQNYLHKCFTRFYYKGLMLYMKNKYSDKSKDTNKNKEVPKEVNPNDNEKEKEKEIEDQKEEEEDKEKSQKSAQKISNAIAKARKLRFLLNQKNKEKLELMRKYFYKFHHAGIILALRKGTKRANLLKKIRGVNLETAFKDIINNKEINEIEVDENSNINDFKEALKKRVKTVKFADDENEDKDKIKKSALEKLLYRADRNNKRSLKNKLEIIFLKSKILSLGKYKRRKKKSKSIKKDKQRSSSIEYDEGGLSDGTYIKRRNTVGQKEDDNDDKEFEDDK